MIRTPEDYRDITYSYLMGCAARGRDLRRADRLARPRRVGRPLRRRALRRDRGRDRRRAARLGIEARILIAAIRNFGVEAAVDIARRHADDRHPYVVGFNLAGDEAGYPPAQFREAYEIAAASGLGCTVHAGEHAGAESVREALTLPGISRISHGVRAVEDPALVAEIAERGIVLEVCPTSNVATKAFSRLRSTPTADAS